MSYVCGQCLTNDSVLQRYVKQTAVSEVCEFCGREEDKPFAADLSEVADYINECISKEWSPVVELLGYAHEDGYLGYYEDTYDLLISFNFKTENDVLFSELMDILGYELWCGIDGYFPTVSENYMSNWDAFAELVKHGTRYFFVFDESLPEKKGYGEEFLPALDLLQTIANQIINMGMIKKWDCGTMLYRARVDELNIRYEKIAELGSPPVDSARPSRMSPAGISMFYGAFSEETTVKEIANGRSDPSTFSIGLFELNRPLFVLDLTDLPKEPSIFEEGPTYFERQTTMFLSAFISSVSRPISKDPKDAEVLEYVPTQVFTEFIRRRVKTADDFPLMGIVYPSSVHEGHASFVLFLDFAAFDNISSSDSWMSLRDVNYRDLP